MKANVETEADGRAEAGEARPRESRKPDLILEAARSIFLEQGYDRSSMDMIAQQAGVSKATVYAHFESKEALLSALVENEFDNDGQTDLWDRNEPITDIEASLRQLARNFTRFFLTDKGLAFHRLIMANASRFPETAEIFMKAGPRRQRAEVGAFLRQACSEGFLEIAEIELAVQQFLSLVQGDLPLNWALSMKPPEQSQYDALIEGGVRVFLAAYGHKKAA
ncbi:TetR/AcrR family transcriptional regulator [Rhizobium paknamense]|uniref:AcrR family transcriptional regulator n=1 Tax=Rhizobium paknamense TaxID=1206817 RepID=A0ABU0IEW9_9HYPH|nr:TetR/AcrR family transcriptional regulator [Rhizobium paknamense]MDQ0456775.1 AcrR family transcriptional regulator [Rhizobium paknamense]